MKFIHNDIGIKYKFVKKLTYILDEVLHSSHNLTIHPDMNNNMNIPSYALQHEDAYGLQEKFWPLEPESQL